MILTYTRKYRIFHRHRKLSQHIEISMKLILKLTILAIFHLRYRSGWPYGSLLCHTGPNLCQKSLLNAIWAMLGFSPIGPLNRSIFIIFHYFQFQKVPINEMKGTLAWPQWLLTHHKPVTYSNQNDIDICAKISHFQRHRKLSQHIDISMKLILKLTILPIFHLRYRSGWP